MTQMHFSNQLLLITVAIIGHVMAAIWYAAEYYQWKITQKEIYNFSVKYSQMRRELLNSVHAPMHAIILLIFLMLGSFAGAGLPILFTSILITFFWAEIWHYVSHRAFHLPHLHWIHAEHHKSRINTPFSAISFSFWEKLIFDLGLLAPIAVIDKFCPLSFAGVCLWYVGYLVINSFSHANFEIKSFSFMPFPGNILTSTTYHSLHHARYVGNFGLGTRLMDRMFGTEWKDYEQVFQRVTFYRTPLRSLSERVDTTTNK